MLCKKPYCRKPTGDIRALAKINPEARLAVTPFPCGQCLHCRINISKIWSHRIKLERDLWPDSFFVTLTYNDDFLPIISGANTLRTDHYMNFLKKLRKKIHPRKIRTFGVGEYGKLTNRPHYHLIIFNTKLGDEHHIKNAWEKDGEEMGFIDVDNCSDGHANYIAGYIVDKLIERGKIDVRVQKPFMRVSKGRSKSICAKMQGGIGYGYAKYIGYKIKSMPWVQPGDIKEIVYGPKKIPLGRYLTSTIAYEAGIDEDVFKLENEIYYEELLDTIYKQVGGDVEKPSKNPYKEKNKAIPYYDSIRATFKQSRLVQKNRYKIYGRKHKL